MNEPEKSSPVRPIASSGTRDHRARGDGFGLKQVLAPLASLRLTVVLLVLAMILIYAGTWAQIDAGIWQVQKRYFHSFFSWVSFQTFLPRPKAGQMGIPGGFPMPGGYTIGVLLLLNLIAAHALRFKATWKDLVIIPGLLAGLALTRVFTPTHFWSLVALLTLAPIPLLLTIAPLHRKRTGVIMIHLGLILLLVGEGVTSGMAVESQMTIDEGSSARYSQDIRHAELAIIDPSDPKQDAVAAIPASRLKDGATIRHSALPVEIKVEQYFPNSAIFGPMQQAPPQATAKATAGDGVGIKVAGQPPTSGVGDEAERVDAPSGYLTLSAGGKALGTYLVSMFLDRPQDVQVGDKTYRMELRFRRLYKPYAVELIDFRHDRYPGTNVPKDFSSHVRLIDAEHNVNREVRIWMNNPLRYRGETFYQSGFRPGDQTTILQVVSNPGWLMPYFACAIGATGLVIHFGIGLMNFIRKTVAANYGAAVVTAPSAAQGKVKPVAAGLPLRGGAPPWFARATLAALAFVVVFYLIGLAGSVRPQGPKTAFDLKSFGTLPVSAEGRVQPLDSLARNSLKVISGREKAAIEKPQPAHWLRESTLGRPEKKIPAINWLADVFGQPEKAAAYPVFRVDNKEVVGMLNLDESRKRFSFQELLASRDKLQEQLDRAHAQDEKQRDPFQRSIVELGEKLMVYMKLAQMEGLLLVPPAEQGGEWQPLSSAMHVTGGGAGAVAGGEGSGAAGKTYMNLVSAYHNNEADRFNREVAAFAGQVRAAHPKPEAKVRFEAFFNRFDPFTQCIVMYVLAFVMVCLSWLFAAGNGGSAGIALRRGAVAAILIALAVHTAGLIGRIYISGRPPVTNLASSAIFIAWGAVILAIGLEFFFRIGVGAACAALIGFLSLLIADRLALSGDTLKVLQAVLDTNFWLATHVIVITLGYAATFLAGMLGVVYVLVGVFTRAMDRDTSKTLARMIYGITCFAILFSFVGTVLGGIWADQSWGRFWGWDPKENGAVLIVLANALLLHARWGGLVRDRGIACLAIFGNIITAWSWFGTNMLGVGLHSYGFMDSAMAWLLAFVGTQVGLIALANLPQGLWRSPVRA